MDDSRWALKRHSQKFECAPTQSLREGDTYTAKLKPSLGIMVLLALPRNFHCTFKHVTSIARNPWFRVWADAHRMPKRRVVNGLGVLGESHQVAGLTRIPPFPSPPPFFPHSQQEQHLQSIAIASKLLCSSPPPLPEVIQSGNQPRPDKWRGQGWSAVSSPQVVLTCPHASPLLWEDWSARKLVNHVIWPLNKTRWMYIIIFIYGFLLFSS